MEIIEQNPFEILEPEKSYHACGFEHGSTLIGKLAEKVDLLGHTLTAPLSYCLNNYVRIFTLPFEPGTVTQKKEATSEALYRTALLVSTVFYTILVLIPGTLGSILRASTYRCKKDFIWEGPKTSESYDFTNQKKEPLSLMTYNMAVMPQFISTRNKLRPTMERSKEISANISSFFKENQEDLPDFIFGQEVFHTEAAKLISEDLKNMGYNSIVRNVGPQILRLNSGLFLASKHRLSNIVFYPHIYVGGIESYANKGLLIATAHVGDKKVIIANTHLNGGAPEGGIFARSIQISGIMSHMDLYVQNMLDNGEQIDGVFLSGDTNIAPTNYENERYPQGSLGLDGKLNEKKLIVNLDAEWFLNPLLHGSLTVNPSDKFNEKQKLGLEALRGLKNAIPKGKQILNKNAWNDYIKLVQIIIDAEFHPKGDDLYKFLTEELPKKSGGPFPPDLYEHDLDSVEKALDGSALDVEFPTENLDFNAVKPERLDFNFVRTKKGFNHNDLLHQPTIQQTNVIHLQKTPSDHHPVRTIFKWE